jgi:hypothetical protein
MRFFLLFMLMLTSAACGGDGSTRICFGTDDFCGRVFGRNLPPRADAGADQQVVSGALVELDGSASHDPDGQITAFSWAQESGPPVALEQATQAIAAFEAPIVHAATVLAFRLLVTDNRGASDLDRVQVTVAPGAVGALARGLQLLKDPVRPDPPAVSGECAECQGFLGLWLGARVEAVAADRDDELDRLLDELRVIMVARSADVTGDPAAAALVTLPQRRLLDLGEQSVAAFTAERDPAISELARRHPEPEAVDAEAWTSAIAAALPKLAGDEPTLAELQQAAERLLLADPLAVPAEWLAAATLVLALSPAAATDDP